MNDELKTDGKMSLAVAGGIGILGVLAGGIATFFLAAGLSPKNVSRPKGTASGGPMHAVITLYDNNKCAQKVNNIHYAYPLILPPNGGAPGSTIDWQGQDARTGSSGGQLAIDVEFTPPGPFTSPSFKSVSGNGPTQSSGFAVGSANDYDYSSVTVGGVQCTSWDPGVHVDQ